jgi:hypothetical protein
VGACRILEKPLVAVGFLFVIYLALISLRVGNRLWFDELFTYYISQAPDLARLFDALQHVDLNPPLLYLLVRLSHAVFGVSALATRLPSVIGFFGASILALFVLGRRTGMLWATLGILMFWASPFILYATEARPYGILLAFFSLLLYSYDKLCFRETEAENAGIGRWRWGIFVGSLGMMLTHTLAPFSILPFCVAEAVRTLRARRIDWRTCIALASPLILFAAYIPLVKNFHAVLFPPAFQASWQWIVTFYVLILSSWRSLLAGFVALIVSRVFWPKYAAPPLKLRPHEIAFVLTLALLPVAVNLVFMRSGGAFWARYCVVTAFGLYLLLGAGVGRGVRYRATPGLVAIASLVIMLALQWLPQPAAPADSLKLDDIGRQLPLVVGNGTTFLEMDHYEKAELLSRVYYLVDTESAARYAHATLFEGLPRVRQYFPIRANITSRQEFVDHNRHFLLLTRKVDPECWILPKLQADGARVTFRYEVPVPYKDRLVYEVEF